MQRDKRKLLVFQSCDLYGWGCPCACRGCLKKKRRDPYALCDLVKEVANKDGKNVVLDGLVLNMLIGLFSRLHDGEHVIEVFNKFEEFKC